MKKRASRLFRRVRRTFPRRPGLVIAVLLLAAVAGLTGARLHRVSEQLMVSGAMRWGGLLLAECAGAGMEAVGGGLTQVEKGPDGEIQMVSVDEGKLHALRTAAMEEAGALLAEEATVQAALSLCVVFTDESGVCRSVLSEVPMTLPLEGVEPNPSLQLDPVLVTRPISYHLSGEGQLELSLDWELQGLVFCSKTVTYLSVAQVDTDRPISQPEDLALKLLFPKAGESLWDIAKRCHTTLEGIRQANEGITEPLEPGTMLMVPIRSGRE